MSENKPKVEWTGKSRGGYFGNKCFAILLKVGMLPAYLLLVFVSAFFLIFRRKLCRGSSIYLSRIFQSKKITLKMRYAHLFAFGMTLLDKVARFAGSSKIVVKDECEDIIKKLLSEQKGLIILASHIGGWEMAGLELQKYGIKASMLGVNIEEKSVEKIVEKERKLPKLQMLGDATNATSLASAYFALKQGEIVAMHADRYIGGRFAYADFLGTKVKFPTAAYALAFKSKAPVLQVLCVRDKLYNYRIYAFSPIIADISKYQNFNAFAEESVKSYAKNLEIALKEHPYEWFNFYDFWAQK